MKTDNVSAYRCPLTGNELELVSRFKEEGKIVDGEFLSNTANLKFEIKDSLPDFTYPKELAEIDEQTRMNYEKLADEYDKFAGIPFRTFYSDENSIREKITDALNIKNTSVVLEVGAGDGRGSVHIANRLHMEGKFFVQELSEIFLRKAINRLKCFESKTHIEFSVASAMYLPFNNCFFDAAHHFGGMNTFSDQKRFFKEMVRVVKPGGKIVVGDEGMAPWLRSTKMGQIMMNSNPLFKYEIPLEMLPVEARNVKVEWVMMGAFFILEFEVGQGEPVANYHIPIPSERGGTHWTRYYGNLEGVTDETKKTAYHLQKKSGKSMHQWLNDLINDEFDRLSKVKS